MTGTKEDKKVKRLILMIVIFSMTLTVFAGCSKSKPSSAGPETTAPQASGTGNVTEKKENTQTAVMTAALYFSDKEGMMLYKETREIKLGTGGQPAAADKAKLILEEMMKGPKGANLMLPIPQTAKIKAVTQDKDTLIVDFSKEFIQDNVGGSTGETMALAPIVLTLTELEGIKNVGFKIEGKTQADFKGHYDISKPFKRSEFEQFIGK